MDDLLGRVPKKSFYFLVKNKLVFALKSQYLIYKENLFKQVAKGIQSRETMR